MKALALLLCKDVGEHLPLFLSSDPLLVIVTEVRAMYVPQLQECEGEAIHFDIEVRKFFVFPRLISVLSKYELLKHEF